MVEHEENKPKPEFSEDDLRYIGFAVDGLSFGDMAAKTGKNTQEIRELRLDLEGKMRNLGYRGDLITHALLIALDNELMKPNVPSATFDGLSDANKKLVEAFFAGKTASEIADEAETGAEEINKHASRVYKKIRVNNRYAAIAAFHKGGYKLPENDA